MESVSPRTGRFVIFSLVLGLSHVSSAVALDPGYIEAVKSDVSEFTTQEFAAPENSQWLGADDNGAAAELDDLAGFSAFIKNKSPGSYIFYKKLPTEYQERLHRDYLETGDLDRIKQDIFKYMREAKK